MPAYKSTALYKALKDLRTQTDLAVEAMRRNKKTLPNDLKKIQYISDMLGLVNDVCKYFDNNQILTTTSALGLGVRLGRSMALFSETEADVVFGTLENHIHAEVCSKLREHLDYSIDRMIANLLKHKESIFKKITAEIGASDPEKMEACFSDILDTVRSSWAPGKEAADSFFSQLETTYFERHEAFDFRITSSELAETVRLALHLVRTLPKDLVELLPFLNPRAIEVDTREPSSVLVSIAKQFLPTGHHASYVNVGSEDSVFQYQYKYTDATGSAFLEGELDWQVMLEQIRTHYLPAAELALKTFDLSRSISTGATQRGTLFFVSSGSATIAAATASPASASDDGMTPTADDQTPRK